MHSWQKKNELQMALSLLFISAFAAAKTPFLQGWKEGGWNNWSWCWTLEVYDGKAIWVIALSSLHTEGTNIELHMCVGGLGCLHTCTCGSHDFSSLQQGLMGGRATEIVQWFGFCPNVAVLPVKISYLSKLKLMACWSLIFVLLVSLYIDLGLFGPVLHLQHWPSDQLGGNN